MSDSVNIEMGFVFVRLFFCANDLESVESLKHKTLGTHGPFLCYHCLPYASTILPEICSQLPPGGGLN